MAFVCHAHCHSEGSPLDGCGTSNQLSAQAVIKGQTHLGRTDHGRLGTALDHVDTCRNPQKYEDPNNPARKRSADESIIPILGIEAFWRPDRFMDLTDKEKYGKNGHNWAQHLCVHAKSLRGWRTLMRLSSKSWVRREDGGGFYGKPCFDWDMLEQDHEDIVISTACMSSPLSQLILAGHEDSAYEWCEDMMDLVGEENLFFEIMPHDLEEQRMINLEKINIANSLGRPFIVTGDVHTPYKDWKDTHSVVRMMTYKQTVSQQEQKVEAGEDTYTEEIDTAYLSSGDELAEMFAEHHPDIPASVVQQGLDNTEAFAHHFKGYVIGKTTKLPRIYKTEREGEAVLREWCEEGLKRIKRSKDKQYRERFEYEFDVLKGKGVIDYFILVGDFIRWAKSDLPLPKRDKKGRLYYDKHDSKRPIRVGLGRGSAAGCLISYLIGITSIDPISWKLLFERFLNPDRIGLPDIDLDFETGLEVKDKMDGRDLVKEYLKVTQGDDHVADIIAYQTFAPRTLIRNVSATQDIPFIEINKVTDSIDDLDRNINKLMADNPVLAAFMEKYPIVLRHATRLEDQIMRDSRHAGGVVITKGPITDYMPTQLGNDEKTIVTAWADRPNFAVVSEYGFVKIDVLGVKSLTKQELCVQLIKEHYGDIVEPNDLPALGNPYDTEQEVIDGFVKGMTALVFQFKGRGITQLLRHIKPDNAIDIAVANALYRPGPIKEAFKYGDRKNGKKNDKSWYWHEAVEPVLKETLGIVAFQEQVMEITKQVGGFTGGQADSMRKAISKLYRLPGDEAKIFMSQFREQWGEGCLERGLSDKEAEGIWQSILEFAGYGFNKSHSASYALQAYQDMWLKIHYPLALYAAGLTIEKQAKKDERIAFITGVLREARIFGIKANTPDVNISRAGWNLMPEENKLVFGLSAISDLGGKGSHDVMEQQPYKSFNHFLKKHGTNFAISKTVALAKAGAFDSLEDRQFLLGQTTKWDNNIAKFKIEMSCGCKKTRTVKVTEKQIVEAQQEDPDVMMEDLLEEKIDDAREAMECKKHPEAVVTLWEEEGDLYTMAQWIKEHPEEDAEDRDYIEPSRDQLIAMEVEALNVPVSIQNTISEYQMFIDERIFTEQEFEELPPKPEKKKNSKMHGFGCQCDDCVASECVVGGEIINVKVIETRGGKNMAFLDIAFGTNQWNATLFPQTYERYSHLLRKPTAFLFSGHKDNRNQLLLTDMREVTEVAKSVGWEPGKPKKKFKSKKNKLKKRKKVAA